MSGTKELKTRKAHNRPEEPANFATYAFAAVSAFVGLVFLLIKATPLGGAQVVSALLLGAAYLFVFVAGALCHVLPVGSSARAVLRRVDRVAVCLLVFGVSAVVFVCGLCDGNYADTVWGVVLFSVVTSCATAAAVVNAVDARHGKLISLVLYVVIGLACTVRVSRIVELCGWDCFWWLVGGGAAYCIGAMMCLPRELLPARHIFWHLFVIAGAAAQFVGVYVYVL